MRKLLLIATICLAAACGGGGASSNSAAVTVAPPPQPPPTGDPITVEGSELLVSQTLGTPAVIPLYAKRFDQKIQVGNVEVRGSQIAGGYSLQLTSTVPGDGAEICAYQESWGGVAITGRTGDYLFEEVKFDARIRLQQREGLRLGLPTAQLGGSSHLASIEFQSRGRYDLGTVILYDAGINTRFVLFVRQV